MAQSNTRKCKTCGTDNVIVSTCERGGADICKNCCESKDAQKHKAGYRGNCNCDTDSYSY